MSLVINGRVTEGGLPPDDRAFFLGDGLFATMLAQAGRLLHWRRHWARLTTSAAALGFSLPRKEAQAQADVRLALAAAGLLQETAAVRLTLTRGRGSRGFWPPDLHSPLLVVTAAPYRPAKSPLRAALVTDYPRNPRSPLVCHKTTSALELVLAQRAARARGADLALLVNTAGRLTEGAYANLFLVLKGEIFTPPPSEGLLPGVARSILLERLPVVEKSLTADCLQQAEAAFVSNALFGVRTLAMVDDRPLRVDHPLVGVARRAWERE